MDDKAIRRSLIRVSYEIIEKNKGRRYSINRHKEKGYPLAQRIAKCIADIEGVDIPVGSVDISLYRDDLQTINDAPRLNDKNLGVEVKGKKVVLVDDVLFTGRTAELL